MEKSNASVLNMTNQTLLDGKFYIYLLKVTLTDLLI